MYVPHIDYAFGIIAVALASLYPVVARTEPGAAACNQDTMIVFDASGSMGGTDLNSVTPRIAKVRDALAKVLPQVASIRPMGLIVYGPGASSNCDSVELRLKPELNADAKIMEQVQSLVPAGRTPLTSAVREAAEVLDYKNKPATIVLITDGEETCGGDPCGLAGLIKSQARDLTIHVIGYRDLLVTKGPFGSRCMADITGGKYTSVDTTDQLVDALRAALGCPVLSELHVPTANRQAPDVRKSHNRTFAIVHTCRKIGSFSYLPDLSNRRWMK